MRADLLVFKMFLNKENFASVIICILILVAEIQVVNSEPIVGGAEDTFPMPTPTSFPTPVSTPTPITESYCRLNSNFINRSFSGSAVPYSRGDMSTPLCVLDMFRTAWNDCQAIRDSAGSPIVPGSLDDCVAWKVFGSRMRNWQNYVGASPTYQSYLDADPYGPALAWASMTYRTTAPYWASCIGRGLNMYYDHDSIVTHGSLIGWCSGFQTDITSYVYIKVNLDGTCSAVSSVPAGAAVCNAGTYYFYQSPISLLWDSTTDLEQELVISNFPIDPRKPNAFSVWRASGKAPLLVYDPKHTGKIKSAFQLLGNWAFGGKVSASLKREISSDAINPENLGVPWADGYEALGSLDENRDGRVSGLELSSLGLWFDYNRNGISEAGEVKQLSEVGVTELYYRNTRQEKVTRSIYADQGYLRNINGVFTTGTSVDWWSDTADTRAELVRKHLSTAKACSTETVDKNTKIAPSSQETTFCPSSATAPTVNEQTVKRNATNLKSISGLWQWSISGGEISRFGRTEGFLGFKEIDGGKIEGHTYGAFAIDMKAERDADTQADYRVSSIKFFGTKKILTTGNIEIRFQLKPESTSSLENVAIFNPRTQQIHGKTLAKVSLGTKPFNLKYSWVGRRMEVK